LGLKIVSVTAYWHTLVLTVRAKVIITKQVLILLGGLAHRALVAAA
jgi:hypothetical protein